MKSMPIPADLHPASAYIAHENGSYQATPLTRGPWNPEHQHAGPPSALAAQAIARVAAPLGLTHFARLTASLIRPIPVAELNIVVETAYSGRNAGHFCAQLFAAGKEVARFTALVQRAAEVSIPSELPGHPLPHAPCPPEASLPAQFPFMDRVVGYADLVEIRVAEGAYFAGPCAAWFRLRHPLVAGQAATPIERVAVAADSGNGLSAVLDFERYLFLNNDLTINLFRPAQGEWICIDARTMLGSGGSGLAEARIFDAAGLIGRSTQSLLIRKRE
jgi:Thioesterase-like superfamily